jgi:hypothetical protein
MVLGTHEGDVTLESVVAQPLTQTPSAESGSDHHDVTIGL